MAGTDRTRRATEGGPAVVLVRPQLGENIGTAARAMYNFGLTDLRLVAPRQGWPNVKALNAAAGAHRVLETVRFAPTVAEAVADCQRVFAATARERGMLKPVITPERAARELREAAGAGARTALLFGPERTGLDNEELVLADALVMIPANPAFASLNLAQAVLVMAYEWFKAGTEVTVERMKLGRTRLATKAELEGFFVHLEAELDRRHFFKSPKMRPRMVRNLRNLFLRVQLTHQDVQTLRGIVGELARPRPSAGAGADPARAARTRAPDDGV